MTHGAGNDDIGKIFTEPPNRTTSLYRITVLALILLNAIMNYVDVGGNCAVDDGRITPAWEVVLRVEGRDVAIAAALPGKHTKFDIVVGVDNEPSVLAYADIIREASFRIATASGFAPLDNEEASDIEST